MPYCIYFTCALVYFTFFLREVNKCKLAILCDHAIMWLVIVNMLLFEAIECCQLRALGFREYFSDFWNILDQLSFFTNATTLLVHTIDADASLQKTIAAIAIFLLYVKFFYWLRLFDHTAAFIRMLKEIIVDIVPFLTFLVICIAMFSNTMLLFD